MATTRNPPAARQARKRPRPRASDLFDRQIDALWTGLGTQCQEFADGYNHEIGVRELDVYRHADLIVVRFADGSEMGVQLDRVRRAVSGWISSGCASGRCSFAAAPLGLAIHKGHLRFAYDARGISEEDLAVRLLSQLTGASEADGGRDRG
jgi:hypothetical protein